MNEVDVYTVGESTQLSGWLSARNGNYSFSYHDKATEALSLTMPTRRESYPQAHLHPIFQMNLPEGALREAIERMTAKQYGSDDLTLLTILGRNQIGRAAYAPPGQALAPSGDHELSLQQILGNQNAQLFGSLLQRYAKSSGVAGVQPKVLIEVKGHLTLPVEHYIIKSWGDDYPHLACNEFVCMSIARDAGLEVPLFYLSDNAKLLLSRRFDISEQHEPLGFEDFCVLQAKGTRQKYDSTLEACTHTIRQYVSPSLVTTALYDFYKLTLLNIRLRNGDAHLKNSGVTYKNLQGLALGEVPAMERRLAPIFDVVSTVPYLPNDTMALSLTGTKRWPKAKVLHRFGLNHCQLSKQQLEQAAEEVDFAINQNLPLLESLSQQHAGFAAIAERMHALFIQKPA